jgi:hypothetical protein
MKGIVRPLLACFILRHSSDWNPHRLHSEPFPPKEKHNIGPFASMTTTTRLGHLFQFCAGSNIWPQQNSKFETALTQNCGHPTLMSFLDYGLISLNSDYHIYPNTSFFSLGRQF